MRPTWRAVAVIVGLTLLTGCGKSNPQPAAPASVSGHSESVSVAATAAGKYQSPEAVFQTIQTATKQGDWQTAASCLTPDSQTMMADGLIIGASFSTMGDPQKDKELTQLLKRHGVDLNAEPPPAADAGAAEMKMPSLSAQAKNRPLLIGELTSWLKKSDKDGMTVLSVDKLTQLKIEGDRATAVAGTSRGERPIEFRKINGGWLAHLPDEGPSAPPPGVDVSGTESASRAVPPAEQPPASIEATTSGSSPQVEAPIANADPSPAPAAEPKVVIDETPREPATVEQGASLLDLRTFPLVEGATLQGDRRQVGQLWYETKADPKTAFEFLRRELQERGWQELPDPTVDLKTNPRGTYTQQGYLVSMSVSEVSGQPEKAGWSYIFMQNHGNVIAGKLPVPDGMQPFYSTPTHASYVTTAPTDATKQTCHKLLLDLGWKPYGDAGDTTYFKQNAILLSARVSMHDAQPGKTFINYSTELLSADLPVPANIVDPRYTDSMTRLSYDQPGDIVAEVAKFYNQELPKLGFKPTTDAPVTTDNESFVVYLNDKKDMISLDMAHYTDLTRVEVSYSTAAENAELERRIKEEAANKAAELARRKAATPKIAIPVPGKAKEVKQADAEHLEIIVSSGAGKPVLEALRGYFQAAGWKEDEASLDKTTGRLRLTKDESSLRFSYFDIGLGEDVELEISGTYVILEPQRDAKDFAEVGETKPSGPGGLNIPGFEALGGLSAAEPLPAAEVAKAPVDLPIPSDARDLTVRAGKNIAYQVAGDIKTVAAYFRTAMQRHGWTYDAKVSHLDDTVAVLSFRKGRSPCGISLTNILGGELTSVTIAGGGIRWNQLRGTNGKADAAVAPAAK